MKPQAQINISLEVLEAIKRLPQIEQDPNAISFDSDLWRVDYLVEQLLRNQLGLKADYDLADIKKVLQARIIV